MLSRHDMEKELLVSFSELSDAEEAFKKKKSRVFWLSLGDKNTKFFHQKMRSHCLRNKVLSLENSNGVRCVLLQRLSRRFWIIMWAS